MLAALELIEIGDHVMFANNCFVGDSDHRYDDPDVPITWQGFVPQGPVRIGANVWFGVNCVVTGGVTIGERAVIGANSVVTGDIPPRVIAAGAPAKVIREIEFKGERDGGDA
jgi:acetyltransferase-like isoleucine patch superfamily enzyme